MLKILAFLIIGVFLSLNREKIKSIYPDNMIHVKIAGNVFKPGLYQVDKDSSLDDLIVKAGGIKNLNDLKYIDLDSTLKDGQVIQIGFR